MTLKLIGEINCHNCNEPLKIDLTVGICNNKVWNREQIQCPYCDSWNIITADIRLPLQVK